MSRDHKGPKACNSCQEAIVSIYNRQDEDIIHGHTTLQKKETESSYCCHCGAEYRLTMIPEGCLNNHRHDLLDTCEDALNYVCSILRDKAKQSGGHLPVDHRRSTEYACCKECGTHVKLSTSTGKVSQWFIR